MREGSSCFGARFRDGRALLAVSVLPAPQAVRKDDPPKALDSRSDPEPDLRQTDTDRHDPEIGIEGRCGHQDIIDPRRTELHRETGHSTRTSGSGYTRDAAVTVVYCAASPRASTLGTDPIVTFPTRFRVNDPGAFASRWGRPHRALRHRHSALVTVLVSCPRIGQSVARGTDDDLPRVWV